MASFDASSQAEADLRRDESILFDLTERVAALTDLVIRLQEQVRALQIQQGGLA